VRKGTAWITLDRPKVRNAIDLETMGRLREAAVTVDDDAAVDQVVVTGAGDVFSAGGDVNEMLARRGKGVATFERHMEGLAGLVAAVVASDKVWVARVNGDAVGAGLGLVLACDLAVASTTARFGAVFGRMGLVADTGVSALLVRSVGLRRAQELLLTARLLDAREAHSWGIVQQAVPHEKLDEAIDGLLEALAAVPPSARGRIKRQVLRAGQVPVRDALIHEAMLQGLSFSTPEHAERVDAFLARKGGGRRA
jgi:2-(1,2-epoxy-1,2-dihydrophenyl)acetyl-CoA isomerase